MEKEHEPDDVSHLSLFRVDEILHFSSTLGGSDDGRIIQRVVQSDTSEWGIGPRQAAK